MAESRKYSTDLDLQGNSIINGGFEQVSALPLTGDDGETVSFRGKQYIWYNGKWNNVADDLGGVEETREEQFTFQPTANDESVKDGLAIVKSIKGNTVITNQVLEDGVSKNRANADINIIKNKERNYTIQGQSLTNIDEAVVIQMLPANIGDYLLLYYKSNARIRFYSSGFRYSGIIGSDKVILNVTQQMIGKGIVIYSLDEVTEYNIEDFGIINLTQMFGAGNEPATVEEFERLYPNLPTEYNEGSLLNLNAEAIKSVGFNAFNGEYAKVLGGMQYYLGGNIASLAFKENLEDEGEVIEIPSDNLYTPNTNGYLVATGNDICINLSHSGYRNGEYEPYKESIVNLPIKQYFLDGMKSAGEVRDEIVWDGEKYKAIQRIGTRAYQTGDEDLADVRTDKTNTYYELETPKTIIDDYPLIDYEVSDFGTEEIIADESTTPIIADIQYGFNAVDEIRNHRFEIRDLKKLLSRGFNLNGVNVKLGDTSTIPAYIPYDDVLYPVRIQGNWLQIYRNGVWGNLFNLASEVIPSLYIEEFEGDWYNPNILEYILSDELTTKLISETLDFRSILTSIPRFTGVKLSLQAFSPKEYDKSLDNILNAVTGYVTYVENDIDTMFNSGNNVLVKLNFDSVNRVTIECYIQR